MFLSEQFFHRRKLENLVENQTSYTLHNAEMHIFETHQQAEKVLLKFNQPVLASMLVGKKVMHLQEMRAFEFLPGESLILPAGEAMCIDFPEAQMDNPTRCLAMTVSEEKIKEVITLLNETMPKADGKEWFFTDYNFHFTNDIAIHGIIQRLIFLFTENHPSKELFADFMLRELIIRVLQAESKKNYSNESLKLSENNRLAHVIKYIREHLSQPINIKDLSDQANMSESNFHRVFKNELGISPIDFINDERIKKASSLLRDPNKKVKEVYIECGFNSPSYFTRLFKRKKQASPREYQLKASKKII